MKSAADAANTQLHALFEAQARRTPGAVALVQGRVQLTYRELNRRANHLARRLRVLGARRESVIGICVNRAPEMVIAMLAALKAGAAYLPLDPTFPRERIAFMLGDASAVLVLTESAFADHYPDGVTTLCLDVAEPAGAHAETDLSPCGSADDLAYIIYTSGSTGKPKGVMIPHRAAVNFLTSMRSLLSIGAGDRLLAATTLTFDPSLLEIMAPLVSGATVVLASSEERADPWRLSELIDEGEISMMSASAGMWRQMVAIGWRGRAGLRAITGGEVLTPALAQDLLARCAEVWNQYGPTETTVAATCWRVSDPARGVFIGTPITNTRCVILDHDLQRVPAGAWGELCIGGLGLARGYLNREAQTAASFIADPFVPGERLYRTGDRARWHPSGLLECAGRIDQQVKVRGFRIELGEIESELRACSAVRGCVVVVREDRPEDQRIVAYVVGEVADVSGLKEQLALRLPGFMLPSHIVVLDAFPLTTNGKIDHAALPAPSDPERSPAQPEVLDPIQRALAAEWADIIGVRRVGIDENFFELGGHSLLALMLLARIEARFGRRLKLATFLMAPTVRAQARLLRDGLYPSTPESLVPIQVSGTRYPLFFASGWGGPILTLGALAAAMGREQPLYLLDYLWAPERGERELSVENVAAALIADVRRLQPAGPYHLVGFSLGATIVYEMAQQLRASGHAVPVLVLLDQRPPGYPLHPSYPVRALMHFERALRSGPVQMWPYLLDHALSLRRYIVEPKARFYEGVTDDDAARIAAELNRSAQALYRASRRYRIQRYSGRLMVITSQDLSDLGIGAYDDAPTAGWEHWADHAHFAGSLPCTHRHMLDVEHATLLAQLLTDCIALGAEPEQRTSTSTRRDLSTAQGLPDATRRSGKRRHMQGSAS